jgi:maltooligosyltrehalose trehalohydrolase
VTVQWGPQLADDGRTRFRLWAPDKDRVMLEIDGCEPRPMERGEDGWFSREAEAGPGARYRFRVAPDLAVPDPASRQQSGGVHGWSLVVNPGAYHWRTDGWRGRPWEEAVIQEVHAGVLGGFSGVAERLPALAELGITAIELMPVAAFGGSRNWGYDGVLPYAVAESYGTPDELKALVDRAHELELMVLLDVVYNHFGPDGNYLAAYASDFFDEHADTPWGGAVAVSREPVRRFFIDNALMWLRDFRFDGLRFDAVHAIADDGFFDAMAREIRAALPGRRIHLVLENERNDPDRLDPELYDAQWNDDFHNVLHVLLTGESEGYYEAFVEVPTARLGRCLKDGFVYQGESGRGKPSGHLPATAFVNFLQNHDQIGNRAFGERLTVLGDPAALHAATALLLLCPQIPLLFMGDESGSRSPFLFFTDFHDELAEAVREGRRQEFARFTAFSDPEARERIPDPNAQTTFDKSIPEPGPDGEIWRTLYADLLAIRHRRIVPHLRGARGLRSEVLGEGAVAAEWQLGADVVLGISINLGRDCVAFPSGESELLFELLEPGDPGSFRAWISR